MISDYGFLCLCSEKEELLLDYGMNMIACHNENAIKIKPEQGMGSVACIINITSDNIEIMPMPTMSLTLNGDNLSVSTPLKENDVIQIGLVAYKVLFKAFGFEQLDVLIEQYLDGQLPSYLSIANLFLEYAKYINITDKQAAFILASIDIPELELKET